MKKYQQIYHELLQKIQSGVIQSGEKLPAENALMEEYGVSRDTVRRSLDLLVQKGFIQKSKGKQATVVNREVLKFPVSEIASFQEINELDSLKAVTFVENLEIIKSHALTKELFGIAKEEETYKIVRTRKIGKEKVILDIDYFRREVVPNLPLTACQNSIYAYLENDLKLKIDYAIKQITVEPCTEKDQKLLDIKNYDLIVVVRSTTYLADGTVFQFTESRHRPDKFKFIDLAKRTL